MITISKYIIKGCGTCIGILLLPITCSLLLAACSDKLDEMPDNRTEIDSKEKVAQLLTSGYPVTSPAVICELSGDNFVDNNVVVPRCHRDPNSWYQEEAYKWADIKNYSEGESDTPYDVWEQYYYGIAVCNHAIAAMNDMMAAGTSTKEDLAAYWGEAHVLRAYLHFVLVNVFSEAYGSDEANAKNMSVPYVTQVEDVVKVDYNAYRKTIAEFYKLIETDILEGLPYIDDAAYSVPAYHFNKRAANAFAARYYLFTRQWEKAEQYATKALDGVSLRNWKEINTNTIRAMLNSYNDETLPCNYLLQSTYSLQTRMLSACRFAINSGSEDYGVTATEDIIYGTGPCWSGNIPAFDGKIFNWGLGSEYGGWLFRVYEYFEYTDKIAGIGYVHMIYQPFTADETLLVRAEAELYQGKRSAAISDLNSWAQSHQAPKVLTEDRITSFYDRSTGNNKYCSDLHPQEMGFDNVLADADLSVLDCILHFRRIETHFEGLRWFDIKRYGITVKHVWRGSAETEATTDYIYWNDPRRALQIPSNVINAGYSETNRSDQRTQNSSEIGVSYVLKTTK